MAKVRTVRGEEKTEPFQVMRYSRGEWFDATINSVSWEEIIEFEDKPPRKVERWHLDGFEEQPDLTMGDEYSVGIEVYRSVTSGGGFVVSLEIGNRFDYVVCPNVSDFLSLVNQMIPLVREARASQIRAEETKHYTESHDKHLRRGDWDEDCEVCRKAFERYALHPGR